MHDQADTLRQLVHGATGGVSPRDQLAPRQVVVAGGKGGVGATTIAVNLAVALVRHDLRVVLVDANFHQPDAAVLCGLEQRETIADVLSGRRTVAEVLQSGPAGIRVLAGDWAAETAVDCPPQAQQRLVSALQRLGCQADLIVVDVGNGHTPAAQRFWQTADLVLLVTTPDSLSILDAYAAIKISPSDAAPAEIVTVVNRLPADLPDGDVQGRIERTCQRFLGRSVHRGPLVRSDPAAVAAAQSGQPLVTTAPSGPAAKGIENLAAQVMRRLRCGGPTCDVSPRAPLSEASACVDTAMENRVASGQWSGLRTCVESKA
jgi:flagellar biosynthesis protein FlhG